MFNAIKIVSSAFIATFAYWWSIVTSVLWHTRLISALAILYLANEEAMAAINCLWDYLVANSFCPWLMIFRGRSSSTIIIEVVNHAISLSSVTNMTSAISVIYSIALLIVELVGGPALGIALTIIFMFISYKCISLVFSKFFNRK